MANISFNANPKKLTVTDDSLKRLSDQGIVVNTADRTFRYYPPAQNTTAGASSTPTETTPTETKPTETKPYNPVNDAQAILDYKRKWSQANAAGDTAGMDAAASNATYFYDRLKGGGRSDIAESLSHMSDIEATSLVDALRGEMYTPTVEGAQAKSNRVMDMVEDTRRAIYDNRDDFKAASDRVGEVVFVDPTATGYGKNILGTYGAAADRMYSNTLGAGIEDAAGNADSYAAAQAARAKQAAIQQGYADTLGFYNALTGAARGWYGDRVNALSGTVDQLMGTTDQAQTNANTDWAAQAQRDANALAERQAAYQAEADSAQAYYDAIAAATNADAAAYEAQAQRDWQAAENAEERASKERIAQINAGAKGTSGGGGSGYRTATPQGIVGDDDDEEQKVGYGRTTTQIISAAKALKDKYGNPDNDAADAYIQDLLDDPDIVQSDKDALARAWKTETGRTLSPRTEDEIAQSNDMDDNTHLHMMMGLPTDEDRVRYVIEHIDAGKMSNDQAQRLLQKMGVNPRLYQ